MSVAAALPPVSGRHRNRALAAARHARAIQLATEGHTYQEIADELGYANRGTVHHIVHQALARDRRDAVKEHQQLELARLDALQAALWDKAMNGDVAAAQEVRAIIMARCRLLGMTEKVKERSRVEQFGRIRRDSRDEGLSIRQLAVKRGVHRRTVRQALADASPPVRKSPGWQLRDLRRLSVLFATDGPIYAPVMLPCS